ncbi:2-succinyl-5-enolpyruvyl-6-hydroxy-3-cyclohexene-1-carboxylic-acid synthase [Glaciihabitans arcticus]|uniref:2-succinyl-5-enolpyruvyl-6-hydroxy-3-cyclohexene-1-carboxylate synthase n=1 Tax=Glaciihabitans arcticus TaxID=2668039 RepID=A0A4Q9GYV4_9MICO|nr:2-succinyl-5-enolpyruvyl-6-hydroxy-3-cyclohexene-1-carboxylic-acid synthase [Glaciihabitans arcticus]TBN58447.1 2-succinyl-5-enolpyruvyl-6-hydroxy-3-cyclohexene-1-carboxylic-acid synthase [Glaciihabitans arcticus]
MTAARGASAPATDFAAALLDEFVRLGVRDVVLSPGSRSQALALVAADRARTGSLRLHVRIDERVGGFLALGLAVETAAPVLIITTSGTAVANLHPAVLEAHHSGVPLIVLSADRPAELRGIGGNQTTQQPGIFGAAVRAEWDVPAPVGNSGLLPSGSSGSSGAVGNSGERDAAASLARDAFAAAARGPVHLNLAFTEPLSGAVPPAPVDQSPEVPTPAAAEPTEASDQSPELPTATGVRIADLAYAPGTVVVAGTGAGQRAEAVARALGAPLLAEVASGAHFGPNLVVNYRALLDRANFGDRVERVIVFGHPTLSRQVPALIQREGVQTIVVSSAAPDDYNPGHRVHTFVDDVRVTTAPDDSPAARSWLGRWVTTSRNELEQHDAPDIAIAISSEPADQAAFNRAVLAGLKAPVTRRALVEAVWRMTWPHDRLVLGASRLIRETDTVVPGKKVRVHANRGLAGIDGTISTAVGIALASQSREGAPASGVTRVLLGDLALLHDVGALLIGAGETRPRIQVIVGNDGGGTIFDGLEVAASANAEDLDRVLLTPHDASIENLAKAYGWEYRRVENRGQLDEKLTPGNLPTIVEVPLPR